MLDLLQFCHPSILGKDIKFEAMNNLENSFFGSVPKTKWICVLVLLMQMVIYIQGQAVTCNHGDVRLVGGPNNLQGRVEICFEGVWGQMCGLRWDNREAQVVCRQLNFNPDGAIGQVGNLFGVGSGPHFFDNLMCNGNEMNLLECSATRLEDTSSCPSHLNTTHVMCQETNNATSTVPTTTATSTTMATSTVGNTELTTAGTSSTDDTTTTPATQDSPTSSPNESSNTPSVTTSPMNSVVDTTSGASTGSHLITSTTEPEPTNSTTLLIIIFGSICGVVIIMLCAILLLLAVIVAKRKGFKMKTRAFFKTSHQRSIDNTYNSTQYGNGRTVDNQLYRNGKKSTVENFSYENSNLTTTTTKDEENHEYSELSDSLRQHVYSEISAQTPSSAVYAEPSNNKPLPYSVPVIEMRHLKSNGNKAVTDSQGYATLTNDARPYEVPQFVEQTTTGSQPQDGNSERNSQTELYYENGPVETNLDTNTLN